jgi:hypothetical protein
MAMTKGIDALIGEVEDLVTVWTANSTKFSMGDTTLDMVKQQLTDLRASRAQTEETRLLLSRLSDSPQYAQVGGTRESERKPRSSSKKTGGAGAS